LQDSKGDSTVKECNRLAELQQLQKQLLSWDTSSPVFDEYYKAHVDYEKDNGEQKFLARKKKQLLLLTNGDVPEKEGAGGLRKKGMAMVAAADTEKIVSFAKKDEEAGARKCRSCGHSHLGPCTQQTNVQTKFDQAEQFMQKLNASKNSKEQAAAMGGLIDMLGHNARPPPRPIGGRGSGPLVGKNGAAGGGGTDAEGQGIAGRRKGSSARNGRQSYNGKGE